ncbi:MAG: hypothetical protein K8H90_06980, partial [Thermoanaerobaculia bacterium]|nr:hypothetical protein [Thermoanaerobaculia bacterium]
AAPRTARDEAAPRPAPKAKPRPEAEPSLRFFYSRELHGRALELLDTVEHASDPVRHRQALGELVLELTDAGLDYYFLRPLTLADSGFLVRQSASLGMSGAKNILAPILRNVVGRMDGYQLKIIAGFVRQLMV